MDLYCENCGFRFKMPFSAFGSQQTFVSGYYFTIRML